MPEPTIAEIETERDYWRSECLALRESYLRFVEAIAVPASTSRAPVWVVNQEEAHCESPGQ